MKVLFLTASYPTPEAPALGIFVKEHARAAALHADVAVLHLDRAETRRVEVEEAAGEEFPTWRVRYPRSPTPVSYAGNLAAAVAGYRRARRRGFDPDVLHAHFFLAGIPAVILGRLLRRPVVVTEQWSVFLPDDPSTLTPLVRRAARFALERADVVMPVSDALRDGIRAAGIAARFRVVPNVVDTHRFHPPPADARDGGPARLLAVGAMYEAKGYEFLLEAVARLADERGDFRLEIVGEGALLDGLVDLRRRLGLEDVVSFLGYRSKDEVAELMRDSDLYVLTSRYDSNPCALIEALATGLPVVATAVGGIPGMVEDGMGLLARAQDPESIAARLREALDRLDGFDRAAIAARARERYGLERVGAAFAEVYSQVLRR